MAHQSEAAAYAAKHKQATTLLDNGKLRFERTGMEFPASVTTATLEGYVKGSFRRTIDKKKNDEYDFSAHEPHIVPHAARDARHFLFCKLTKKTLPRNCDDIDRHVKGRRFQFHVKEAEEKAQIRQEQQRKSRERRAKYAATPKDGAPKDGAHQGKKDEDKVMEEQDVLQGILSDEEPDVDNSGSPEEDEPMMDEDEGPKKKEAMVMSRSPSIKKQRKGASSKAQGSGDTTMFSRQQEPSPRKRGRKRRNAPVESMNEETQDQPAAAVSGGKRRVKAMIPKKVRQARQRRRIQTT